MASDYKIVSAQISAHSDTREVAVPIPWEVKNPSRDISVFLSNDSGVSVFSNWLYDGIGNVCLTVSANDKPYAAYIFRAEAAAMLASLTSSGEVKVSDIIAQLAKNVRCLEQFEEGAKTGLRSVDKISPIPTASYRAGKLLSFDSNGQPVCSIVAYTKEEILAAAKPYVDSAAASAKSAGEAATLAGDYAAQATTAATTATAKADAASASATAASNAQVAAEQARTDASAISDEASVWMSNAQEAAQAAATSSSQADAFQAAAASSATQAAALRDEAEYFAGQAADSKTAAEQARNAAEQSATTAGVMADAAEGYSVMAATANSSAIAKANAAESSAQAAQQAAAQATAISDPEGWRTATRGLISDLAASKVDVGTFHFGTAGGALQTTGNPMFGVLDQSHCITLELDEDFQFSTHRAMSLNFTGDNQYNSGYYGIGLTLGYNGRFLLRAGNGTRDGGYFGNAPFLKNVFGGTDNNTIPAGKYAFCLCMHFDATDPTASTARIYVNGAKKWDFTYPTTTGENNEAVALQTSTIAWLENSKLGFFDTTNYHKTDSTNFGYGHFEGKASRFAVFNFDMSAAGAPYTVADYVAGKIPPLELCNARVQWGSFTATGSNPTLTHGADDSFAAAITKYNTGTTIPSFNIPFKAKKGTKVRFRGTLSWTSTAEDTLTLHFSIRNSSDASASTAPYEVSNGTAFDFELEANDDIAYIGMRSTGATSGSTITYTGTLHVERDAVVLAAADYAIARNSTTRLVKDISGNGNDLTVCGDVVGDKDAAVAAFIDELKTQISQTTTNS